MNRCFLRICNSLLSFIRINQKKGGIMNTYLKRSIAFIVVLTTTFVTAGEIKYSFEGDDNQGWYVGSGNFTDAVSLTSVYDSSINGSYAISTLYNGTVTPSDDWMGVVESPVITLADGTVTFIQGGGSGDAVYFAVYSLDGTELAVSRGINNVNGCPTVIWTLADYVGQKIYFRLVDSSTGAWGHTLIDNLTLQGEVDETATSARRAVIDFNFENGNDQGWFVSSGNINTAVSLKNAYSGASGQYIISTHYENNQGADTMTGVVESPVMTLNGGTITFMQGGGQNTGVYFAAYTLDGTEIMSSRGKNSVNLSTITWNLSDYIGQKIYLRLVDNETGDWGHTMIDHLQISATVNQEASELRKQTALAAKLAAEINSEGLRMVIADLKSRFPEKYPADNYSIQIEAYLSLLKNLPEALKENPNLVAEMKNFKRKVLLSNPLLISQPLLITVREQYWGSHCAHGTMYQNGEDPKTDCAGIKMWRGDGGRLKVLNFNSEGSIEKVDTLIDLPQGVVRDPEVNFEGDKLLFSMRRGKDDDYNLYEMKTDATELKQLTFGKNIADVDPVYMPDGKIIFSSTREPKYCQCNTHAQPNMFQMDGDGANIVQISRNNLADFHNSLMPDGRIMYSRWEYVDRHFGPSLGLWTSNPDGTNHQLYMGNNAWTPGAMLNGMIIPGTNKVVTIYGACHDLPWGALVIADRSKGMEGPEPIEHIWPASSINRVLPSDKEIHRSNNPKYFAGGGIDSFGSIAVKYEDPYPLHNMKKGTGGGTYFLVSKTIDGWSYGYGQKDGYCNMGIFLVDIFGNETLVYSEPTARQSCFSPIPIAPRKRPPVIPSRVDLSKKEGTLYVMDVYQGDGDEMEAVKRGSAKYIRILEAPPKKFWNESRVRNVDARQASPMNWNLTNNKRILGDVPVEADGSAYFKVPSDKFIHFLLLDENKMMIQAMRTGTMVRPGEIQGCIGCHENRLSPPSMPAKQSMAMKLAPSKIQPWYGYKEVEDTPQLNYYTEIQPAFDRNCVTCHDYGKKKSDGTPMLNLAGDLGLVFNNSYMELMRKSRRRYDGPRECLISVAGDGPPGVLPAFSWGSHKSTLIKKIRGEHADLNNDNQPDFNLSKEDFERIVTWIDCNGVYYGAYASFYNGRTPLSDGDLYRLLQLGGVSNLQEYEMSNGSLVSFERPELSPILARVSEANRTEALAIINRGKNQLTVQPREDMLEHEVAITSHDLNRVTRHSRNISEDEKSQQAIRKGSKYYQYRDAVELFTINFNVDRTNSKGIKISWSVENGENITEYRIEKLVKGEWITIATVNIDDEFIVVDNQSSGEEYRLIAIDKTGASLRLDIATGQVVQLKLQHGWNLLSLPFDTELYTILNIPEVSGPIWIWDTETASYKHVETITAKEGLWVYAIDASSTTLGGIPVAPEINVSIGWNLFGPVTNSLVPASTPIYSWNNIYEALKMDGTIYIGKAYWLFSQENALIDLPVNQ